MKKTAEYRKTGISNVVTLMVMAAAVVLLGAGGARAEFISNHPETGLIGWTASPSGGWEIVSGEVDATGWDRKFLTNNTELSDDGYFRVVMRRVDNWMDGEGEGIVFRWTSQNRFYYIGLNVAGTANWGNGTIRFGINRIVNSATNDGQHAMTASQHAAIHSNSLYSFIVRVQGSSFTVARDIDGNRNLIDSICTFVDADNLNPSGRAGYAALAGGNNYARFVSSQWISAHIEPATAPAGFHVWNAVVAGAPTHLFTPGEGNWGNDWWTSTNSEARGVWPSAGANAMFPAMTTARPGPYTVTVNAAASVGTLRFGSNGWTIGGTAVLTKTNPTIEFVNLAGTAVNNGTVTINAPLAGTAGLTFGVGGSGRLTLGGANTFSGAVRVGASDTVVANNAAAFGAATVNLDSANAHVRLAGSGNFNNAFNISGAGATLTLNSGANVIGANGRVTMNRASGTGRTLISSTGGASQIDSVGFTGTSGGTRVISTPAALTVNAVGGAAGSGGFTKEGAGTLTIGARGFNNAGAITVSAGSLVFAGRHLGTSAITMNGDSLIFSEASTNPATGAAITLGGTGGATLVFNRGTSGFEHSAAVSGTGNIVKRGGGTLTLSGNNSALTGILDIAGGVAAITGANNLPSGGANVASGATLRLTAASDMTFAGTFSGAGTFDKAGGGAVTIGSIGTDSTSVSAGGLIIGSSLASNTRVAAGAWLTVGEGAVIGRNISLLGTAELRHPGRGSPVHISGALNMAATSRIVMPFLESGESPYKDGSVGTIAAFYVNNQGAGNNGSVGSLGILELTGTGRNITRDDEGEYRIMQFWSGTAATLLGARRFADVRLNGTSILDTITGAGGDRFAISQAVVTGGSLDYLVLRIERIEARDIANNFISVGSVRVIAASADVTRVEVTLTGFTDFRSALNSAGCALNTLSTCPLYRPAEITIFYRAGAAATNRLENSTAVGAPDGRHIVPTARWQSATTGDALTVEFDIESDLLDPSVVPSGLDSIFVFNAVLDWITTDGTPHPQPPHPPSTGNAQMYLRDPRDFVLANNLTITVAGHETVEPAGTNPGSLTFTLTVGGVANAAFSDNRPYRPRVDSVGVWISRNVAAPLAAGSGNALNRNFTTPAADTLIRFSLAQIRAAPTFTFVTGVVPQTHPTSAMPFQFAAAPRWRLATPANTMGMTDTIARPLQTTSQSVPRLGNPVPNNPLEIAIVQPNSRETLVRVTLTLPDGSSLNEHSGTVEVELSFDPAFEEVIGAARTVAAQTLNTARTHTFDVNSDDFVGSLRPLYARARVLSNIPNDPDAPHSSYRTEEGNIGRSAPVFGVAGDDFEAEILGGGVIEIRWNELTLARNNVLDDDRSSVHVIFGTEPFSPEMTHAQFFGGASAGQIGRVNARTSDGFARINREAHGLEAHSDIYIAAIVIDSLGTGTNAVLGNWTLGSAPVLRGPVSTGSYDITSNIIDILSVTFDPDSAWFVVNFGLLFENAGAQLQYVFRVVLGEDTVLTGGPDFIGLQTGVGGANPQTFRTAPLSGRALFFDTTYTFIMRTVYDGELLTGQHSRAVAVGSFSRQTAVVEYTPDGRGDGWFDSGRFRLGASHWPPHNQDVLSRVTVGYDTELAATNVGPNAHFTDPYADASGAGGHPGYRVLAVAPAASGVSIADLPPFTVTFDASGIHPRFDDDAIRDRVRIYRWTGSYWEVMHDTRFDPVSRTISAEAPGNGSDEVTVVYRLLINERKSEVLSGQANLLSPDNPVHTLPPFRFDLRGQQPMVTFNVQSGVGNVRARVIYAPARDLVTSLNEAAAAAQPPTGMTRSHTFTFVEDSISRSQNFGLLAFLIVDDGTHVDTINISREIIGNAYPGFQPINPRRWQPFAAHVRLVSADDDMVERRQVQPVLDQIFERDNAEFEFDNTRFRLFRWGNDAGTERGWAEYTDFAQADNFALEPARLMWIKVAESQTFNFGATRTASLAEPFAITIPAGRWVDFVSPFAFGIRIGDVLHLTDSLDPGSGDNIEFYRWREQGGRYSAASVSLPASGGTDSSVVLETWNTPFTVFNNGSRPITLRIPPRPALMSRFAPQARRQLARAAGGAEETAPSASSGAWRYTITGSATNSPELGEVMIGNDLSRRRAFAVPPAFSNESIVIVDENGRSAGHYFGPEPSRGGTIRLRLYNDERSRSTFRFRAVPSAGAPFDAAATFVDAVTGEVLGRSGSALGMGDEMTAAVSGNSHRDILMIMGGTSEEAARVPVVNLDARFQVGAVMVNRSARSVRIRYFIPYAGVDRVEISVFDIRGRQIWRNSIPRVRPSSWNTAQWNSRESRRGGAAAGVYVIRVRAIDANGRTTAVESRRVAFGR